MLRLLLPSLLFFSTALLGAQEDSVHDLMRRLSLSGNEQVLDVGCGDGKITAALSRKLISGRIYGVDLNPEMIHHATNYYPQERYPNLRFVKKDARLLDYNEEFDLITSFTVLQWVPEQLQALRAMKRGLKPMGRLLVTIPNEYPLPLRHALDQTMAKEEWKGYFANFNNEERFFTEQEYRKLLEEAGMRPLALEVTTKDEIFPNKEAFSRFIAQWLPYLQPLPKEKKQQFLDEVIERYFDLLPLDSKGQAHFVLRRLEVEAVRAS